MLIVGFILDTLAPETASTFNQVTSLSWGDVAVDSQSNPSMLRVHLKKSKCD